MININISNINRRMANFVLNQGSTFYRLDLKCPTDISDVTIKEKEVANDRFTKYDVSVNLEGKMYEVTDTDPINPELTKPPRKIGKETFSEYLLKRDCVLERNVKWIYNIIDGKSEQDRIIHKENDFIIIPTLTWNGDKNKLHVLAIVSDKSLMTIRDLRGKHIDLLKKIYETGLDIVSKEYSVDRDLIRTYIHYPPSTWLLHIHFQIITHVDSSCAIEQCHNLPMVIQNLEMEGDYYKKVIMETLV